MDMRGYLHTPDQEPKVHIQQVAGGHHSQSGHFEVEEKDYFPL